MPPARWAVSGGIPCYGRAVTGLHGDSSAPGSPARLALGCAAGVAVGVAATWLRFAWERTLWLETGTLPYLVSAFVVGVGLALAGACALRLERHAGPVTPAHLRWGIALQLIAAPALALTSLDLFSNLAYGQLQLVGRNPYLEGPRGIGEGPLLALVSPRWIDTPSAYGPVSSIVGRLAAGAGQLAGSPLWGGGVAFKLAMVACAVATLVIAYVLLRDDVGPDAAGRFALVAFVPLLAWEISAQGHNDGLLVAALMVFVWAASRRRDRIALVALTVGALAKAPAAPLLVLYWALVARTSWRRALVLAALVGAITVSLVGPYWHGLATLQGAGAAAGGDVERHAHSLADLLALVLQPAFPRVSSAAYWVCWLGSIALCAFVLLRGLRRATSAEHVIHDALLLFLTYCLTTPWFQPWYASWLLPLALVERNAALRRVVALYAVLTVVQWALPLDPFSTVAVNGWIAVLAWRALGDAAQRTSQDGWRRTGAAPVI